MVIVGKTAPPRFNTLQSERTYNMEPGLNFNRVAIDTTGKGSPAVLSTGTTGKFIYLHALYAQQTTTGQIAIQSITTGSTSDLTGGMSYAAKDGPKWPFDFRREACLRSQLSGNLQVTPSTKPLLDGWAVISQSTPDT